MRESSELANEGRINSPLLPKIFSTANKNNTGDYVDDLINWIGLGMFQIAAFLVVGMTYVAYTGEALTFAFISIPVMNEWSITPVVFSLVSASTFVGNIIGETVLSYIADRYGRFWPYLISMVMESCLVLGSAFAPNFYVLLVLRMLASIGIGGVIVLSYPILMEFLPIKYRARVSILNSLVTAVSSCAAAGVAWLLVPSYALGWRYFIICTSFPGFVAIVLRLIFFVESPRYLVSKGKLERAWKTFRIMAKLNCKCIDDYISKEEFMKHFSVSVSETKNATTTSHHSNSNLRQLLTIFKPPLLRHTVCMTIVYTFQIMIAYGTTLFLPYNLKILNIDPYVCSFIAFTAEIPGVLFLAIVVEWPEFGRKNTIRFSSLFLAILYFLFAFVQNEISIPVLTVLIYFLLIPIIPVMIIYMAESYPTEIRVMALAVVGNIAAIFSIGLTLGAGYLAEESQRYTWLGPTVWGSMFVMQFLVELFLKHETRGKSLQENVNIN